MKYHIKDKYFMPDEPELRVRKMTYKNIEFILYAIQIILSFTLSSNAFSQVDVLKIKIMHLLGSKGDDTLFYVNADENKDIGLTRASLFVSKTKTEIKLVKEFYYENAYIINYIIEDINADSIKEVIVFDEDEGNYSISIYQAQSSPSGFRINKIYEKGPLYLTHADNPNLLFDILQIEKKSDGNHLLTFYFATENGRIKAFTLVYSNRLKKFILK